MLRGTSANATGVEFKAVARPTRRPGDTAAWSAVVRLPLGTTVVQVKSTGPGGTSTIDKVTIVRK